MEPELFATPHGPDKEVKKKFVTTIQLTGAIIFIILYYYLDILYVKCRFLEKQIKILFFILFGFWFLLTKTDTHRELASTTL